MESFIAKRPTAWICALLVTLTLIAFWPVLNNDFIKLDDHQYVLENPNVQNGLTWAGVKWSFQAGYASNWHPLTWISHLLDVQLFGFNPSCHHAVNLFLHCANTLLLFLLLQRMTKALWRCAFVTALFALHPLHVESVAWVAERKDVLSGFFFLLTLLAYVRFAECKTQNSKSKTTPWRWYGLSLLLFTLGLMSKPMLVTVPCLLLLLDFWPLHRFNLKDKKAFNKSCPSLFLEKVPFLILCLGSSYVTFLAQDKGHSVIALEALPLSFRLANAVATYLKYLGKTFWPAHLVIFYPYPAGHDGLPGQWPDELIAVAALVIVALSIFSIIRIRHNPWLAVGWFWYLGMLVPVIGIVQVGAQSMADRYTYLPSIGVFIAVTWGAAGLFARQRSGKIILSFIGAAVLLFCACSTRWQTLLWRNSFTLFNHALEVDPNNPVALDIVGQELWKQGQIKLAKEHFLAAMRADPHYEDARQDFSVSSTKEAATLAMQGKLDQAVEEFQSALQIKTTPQTLNGLGLALWQLGRRTDALEKYAEALRLQPDDAAGHEKLGILYSGEGLLASAAFQFEEVLRLRPDAQSHYNLGMVLAMQQKVGEAILHFEEAVRLQPDSVAALNALAWLLATTPDVQHRSGTRAVELAEQACRLTDFKQAQLIGTLAAAYAEEGRFKEAVATAEKARDLAMQSSQSELATRNEQLLELYRSGQPFHEAAAAH